jgi:hypothetical protein
MTAASTGYALNGLSSDRLAYWEAWGHWHINALAQAPFSNTHLPNMKPLTNFTRAFSIPSSLEVPLDQIKDTICCIQE